MSERLEQHHIRYKEIHGEDEIIMLSHGEHMKVHREDKANGAKPIPEQILKAAHSRSPLGRISNKKFRQSDAGKQVEKKMKQSETGRVMQKRHRQSKVGKIAQIRASQSEASKEAHKKYNQTAKGKAVNLAASVRYYAKQKEVN